MPSLWGVMGTVTAQTKNNGTENERTSKGAEGEFRLQDKIYCQI